MAEKLALKNELMKQLKDIDEILKGLEKADLTDTVKQEIREHYKKSRERIYNLISICNSRNRF